MQTKTNSYPTSSTLVGTTTEPTVTTAHIYTQQHRRQCTHIYTPLTTHKKVESFSLKGVSFSCLVLVDNIKGLWLLTFYIFALVEQRKGWSHECAEEGEGCGGGAIRGTNSMIIF